MIDFIKVGTVYPTMQKFCALLVFQTIANMTFLEELIPKFPVLPNVKSFIIPQLNSPNITGY